MKKVSKAKASKTAATSKTLPVWHLNVVSSNIKSARFNVKKGYLYIVFHSGKEYRYSDVTQKEFLRFTLAPSQGKFLNEFIKPTKKVREV